MIVDNFINYETKELNIDEQNWIDINSKYTKDEIKKDIIDHVLNGDISLPMSRISYEEAKSEFEKLVNTEPLELQEGLTFTKAEYEHNISNVYIGQKNLGNKASNYFQQYNRMCASGSGFNSPVEIWKNEKRLMSVLNPLWSLKMKKVNTCSLLSGIALRAYVCSQFKPIIAKTIYSLLHSKDVLDFSSGWGDRLCGFWATKDTKTYIGVDPNTALHPKYQEQIDLYKSVVPDKSAIMIHDGAENVDYSKYSFDTIFTSPPYFNAEHYSQDEKQSFLKFKSDNDWLNNFLFKVLEKSWKSLKPDGFVAINISDIYDKKGNRIKICDPMIDFVTKELKGKYTGCIGMKMSVRPNMHSIDNRKIDGGVFVEPVWIFNK